MRDLILVGVTALVSASGGALLTMSLNGEAAPAVTMDGGDRIDVAALLNRVTTLEEMIAADSQMPRSEGEPVAPAGLAQANEAPAEPLMATPENVSRRRSEALSQRQRQAESRLRDAGWTDQEIAALDDMHARASLEFEQRQYESMRQRLDENPDMLDRWPDPLHSLRAELGDERYEQYLEAQGRSTSIRIENLLAGSAGAAAGLQSGDQILRYGSQRVFNERDLMVAMLRGEPGESVTLEIDRDGSVFHVTVPRGPLGTSNRRRAFMN
jgi:C-terminal processing protease CtpA/Prc